MSSLYYVTIEEAKQQLRMRPQDTYDDAYIDSLVVAASNAVKNYLKSYSVYESERNDDDDPILDSNYEPIIDDDSQAKYVKPEVKQAVLLLVGDWYRNREAGTAAGYDGGSLPAPVRALLYQLRDPACR